MDKKHINNITIKEKGWLLKEKYKNKKTLFYILDSLRLDLGHPLAYLIGNTPFLDTIIDLKYKPLIPRAETEFWLNEFLNKKVKNNNKNTQILDIFSGSGCLGVATLFNTENTNLDFAEINSKYIKQIKTNLNLNKIKKERYQIFKSNIFKSIPEKKYDFILANPPYISKNKKDIVQKTVLSHEDPKALFAKENGLFFIKKTITIALKKYLKNNGEIWIECDPWQTPLLEKFLKEEKIKNFFFLKDQYQKNRVIIITKN